MSARYAASFAGLLRPQRKLRIVVACGNGTAGLFAPSILAAAGITVIPLDCQLDADFPNCDPNPEDVLMLGRLGEAVRTSGADAGLAFDGDGDRCGFADETGRAISADRVGLLLARGMALRHPGSHFLADVKSTGLFARDPVLRESGATVEYWKTGHSYMRQRLLETRALAAFEKSGHFFFNHPEGLGYDDAIATGLAFCRLLGNGASVSQLDASLGTGFVTPTMSPHCPDHCKYQVVDAVTRHYQDRRMSGATMAGHAIIAINRLSGARIELADGSWGLVRASSNKPELTVVCESPASEAMMHTVFADIDAHLASYPDVGPYNQKIAKPHKS